MQSISKLLTEYPKHLTKNLFNLLDSHDTERILNVVGNVDKVKLAYLFLLTFPGTPSIYYGSEIGMDGGEHSNRQCMIWDEDKQNGELFAFIRQLIELRMRTQSFRSVELSFLSLATDRDTILYKKSSATESIYVLIHNEPEPEEIMVPEELKGLTCYDLIDETEIRLGHTLLLKPYDYRVYKLENEQ
jgi:glycosidase